MARDQEPPEGPSTTTSASTPGESRRLAAPPSSRYAARPPHVEGPGGATPSALRGPLVRASLVAIAAALLLTLVGAVLASTAGLLFVAGIGGTGIGLALARAAAPPGDSYPIARGRVTRIAVGLSLAAVVAAALATWVIARGEGGVLNPLDYLLTTFGPFVPTEAVIAAVGAWWGAHVGPVNS